MMGAEKIATNPLTPAHAGNTPSDHLAETPVRRSPPRTREILGSKKPLKEGDPLTPAHAGNTGRRKSHQPCIAAHPRARGKYSRLESDA